MARYTDSEVAHKSAMALQSLADWRKLAKCETLEDFIKVRDDIEAEAEILEKSAKEV